MGKSILEIQNLTKYYGKILGVENLTIHSRIKHKNVVRNVSFNVREGEIVCVAGIEGNGQTELVYGITGLEKAKEGKRLR